MKLRHFSKTNSSNYSKLNLCLIMAYWIAILHRLTGTIELILKVREQMLKKLPTHTYIIEVMFLKTLPNEVDESSIFLLIKLHGILLLNRL